MIKLSVFIFLLLTSFSRQEAFSQERKSDKEFRKYFNSQQLIKVDTVLFIKSGCTGCDVKYEDEPKSVIDVQTIYVLTKKSGQFKLAIFDDIHSPIYILTDTCSLFDTIDRNKSTLSEKDTFYKKELAELKKSKFLPPRPIHYSFEELVIKLPGFQYDFVVNGKNADYLGFVRENEKWFQETKNIIEIFIKYYKQLKADKKSSTQQVV
jgi:hypothetical protein